MYEYWVQGPAEEKLASPQPASGKLHVVGMGRREILSARGISVGLGKTPRYAVSVLLPGVPLFASVPPGPGSVIRNMLGWTVLEKTARSGLWWFRGAYTKEEHFPAFVAAGDWVRKGSHYTAWAVPPWASCACSYAYGHGPAVGPLTGKRCWPLLAKL